MIRVLIERSLIKGKEADYHRAIRQMKRRASHKTGYISGETLVDPDNESRCLVLSSWTDNNSWQTWAKSEEREYCSHQIREMLTEDEKISVYQSATISI